MTYVIRSRLMYVKTEIDSSGMYAYIIGSHEHADKYSSKEEAEQFLIRLQERYPKNHFHVEKFGESND